MLQITTANCHTITKPDVVANNGIVHVVDSVLTPVVETLMDIVSKNPELSTFKTGKRSSRNINPAVGRSRNTKSTAVSSSRNVYSNS